MSVLKKLAGETALYGISSILGRLLNYALVPLHTAIFFPAQMAIVVELFAYVAVLNVLYTYGMETAYFRFASKSDPEKYYNTSLSAIMLSSLLFSVLIIILATPLTNALGYPGKEIFIIWFALIIAIDAIVSIPFARLRLEKKAKQFVFARMANIFLNVGLNFFFLWLCKDIYEGKYLLSLKPIVNLIYRPDLGVGYIILANLIANAAFFPLLWKSFARFKPTLQAETLKSMWIYAYPILFMGLAGTLNLMTDRLFLKNLLPDGFYPGRSSVDALGIYGNCYKLSIFMSLVIQAFRYAAEPFFFSQAEDKNAPETFANVMKWFVIACVFIWLGVSVNLDLLGAQFLRKPIYREGLGVVPVLLLANLFLGVYYNLSVWFKLTDRTHYGTIITTIGAVLTVVLNYLLIPVLGYMGCALTFLVSCFAMTVICYTLGQKYFPVPYKLMSAIGYITSAGILIYLVNVVQLDNQLWATGFHMAICITYTGLVFLLEKPNLVKSKALP
jgi:O-antigen/teichoic acid export membrane protein